VSKLFVLAFFSLAMSVNAQPVDKSKNKNNDIPISTLPPNSLEVRPATFEDYLVQQAWKNSFELESTNYDIDSRSQEILLAKKDWTRNVQVGVNLNEVSYPYFLNNTLKIKRAQDTVRLGVTNYPLWNLGASINIGDFVMRKSKVKIAENKKKMSESEAKLKGEVLKRYQEYLSAFDVFKVRIQALDAAESTKNQIQSLFSVNKVQFEDYNTANKAYYDALENKVKGEGDIKLKRIALEEILGTKWEAVERVKGTYEEKKKN
jgi:outer membrane protein TolC